MNKKFLVAIAALAVLVTVSATFLATLPVQAKNKDRGKGHKKIEWSQKAIKTIVGRGETVQTSITFTPTVNIENAEFRTSASVSGAVSIEPSSFAALTAGTPYQITVTFTAPADQPRKKYHGVAALVDDSKLYAKPLKLRFGVNKK